MGEQARGSFEVRKSDERMIELGEGASFGRTTFDKRFEGDFVGRSVVVMLSVAGQVAGSAAYVALEHMYGTLSGRTGAFDLQHNGTLRRGAPELTVSVVPDSGTGELKGLTGKLTIDIVEGKHFYVFDYAFAD